MPGVPAGAEYFLTIEYKGEKEMKKRKVQLFTADGVPSVVCVTTVV
jgi:hypothetical protein